VLGVGVALAGAVAAAGCCLTPARGRARVLALTMAIACLPFLSDSLRIAAALIVLALAMLLAAGLRRRPARDRSPDLHRAIGGALMAGMLLAGGHAAADSDASHAHAHAGVTGLSPHVVLAVAAATYVAWTITAVVRRGHDPASTASRIELIAMGAMFALSIAAMALG